eukprot:GFUD01028187.1.p1 GENE.GFUD01028187.1~~GFUD01028187.1.p1  ORF type:complete len:1141 (+),score=331.65 GFUD01028187.1:274-3696(+)
MDNTSVHDESFNEFDNVESLIEDHMIPSNDDDAGTIPEDIHSEFEYEVSDEIPNESDMEEPVSTEDFRDLDSNNVNPSDCYQDSESESEVNDVRNLDSQTISGSDEGQIVSQVHPVQVHNITTSNQPDFEAQECGSQMDFSDVATEQLDQEYTNCESQIDKCDVENVVENIKIETIPKTSVAALDRKESDGTSFWSNSAKNSVVSMLDSNHESKEHDTVDGAEVEPLRKILQKKRSSLSHKPDIVRVFEKKSIQQNGDVHEFQKVMCGLKHVEDQSFDIKKDSDFELVSNVSKKPSVIATENKESNKVEDSGKGSKSNAKKASDMKVDLIQDAVEKDLQVSKTKTKDDKASTLNKKKQSNKAVVKATSRTPPQEKEGDKENKTDKLKKTSSKSNSLMNTKSKTTIEAAAKSTSKAENDQTSQNKIIKSTRKVGNAMDNSRDNLKNKSVKDKPLSKMNARSKQSDKDIPAREKTISPDIISSHKKSNRKDSTESQSSKKSDTSEEQSLESDNPAELAESNAKEGFLAPTKAWLSHAGNKIDVRSRTPSPAANEKKSSTEIVPDQNDVSEGSIPISETDNKKIVSNPATRKSDKLAKAPPVKRTFSLRSKPITPKIEDSVELKRSTSLRKPKTQVKDIPSTENKKTKSPPQKKTNQLTIRNSKTSDKNAKLQTKNQSENLDCIDSPKVALPKKVPPPVAPKPACPNTFNIGCQLNDSAESVSDNSTMKTTAMVTLNQSQVKPTMKKIVNKTSIADIAKLADSLEIVVNETLHQTQFVSQAKATLSPVPQRKVRDAISIVEDAEDENNSGIESGIVSESVSASSVIQMFGGVGKFKKVAKEEPIVDTSPDPVSSANEELASTVTAAKEAKKKGPALKRADSKKMSSGKSNTKEKQAPKSTTSQVTVSRQRAQETAKNSRSQGSTKTKKDITSNLSESKSDNTTSAQKQENNSVKTDSSKSISKESTFVKTSSKTAKKESVAKEPSKIIQKKLSENKIDVAASKKSNSPVQSSNSKDDCLDPKTDNKQNGSVVKTTMVVRLHPGQTRKLSNMEEQEGDQTKQQNNSVGWLTEVQAEDDPSSVCGLEISFKSVPQDIDIKLISGQANSQPEKQEAKTAARSKSVSKNSITRKSIDLSPDLNKTRQ